VGLNRVTWDLRNEATQSPRMRTKPLDNPEFVLDADGTRDTPGFGGFSVLLPPGRSTVQLTVDGQTQSQPLEVRKDPNSFATDRDIQLATEALLRLQGDQNAAAGVVNTVENLRAQLQSLQKRLGDERANAALRTRGDSLERKLMAVEARIQDLRQTGRGQDGVRWPVMAGGQISYLAGNIATSSFAPTQQQGAVYQVLQKQVQDARAALDALLSQDVAAFNRLLTARGQPALTPELPKPIP
jgi:hypothetical protein